MSDWTFFPLSKLFGRRSGISRNTINARNYQYLVDKPAWLSLANAHEYRRAAAENPVVFGCIDILASAASNGRKYLVDLDGKVVPWSTNKAAVKNARKLFVDRPNPQQSVREFDYERYWMFFVFGNNYIFINNPSDTLKTDILTAQCLWNLPSEYVEPKQTGRLYDQIDIAGIIEKYALTNYNPVKEYDPDRVIHFNDINTSDVGNGIIGSSRLENLRYPITNTQLAFEAMNVILKHRGMQGIIKANNKDGTGTQVPLDPKEKAEIEKTFKTDYGTREDQKLFMLAFSDIDYIKTIMSPQEMGIYNDFSNNAMIISNGLKVPPELYKTYIQGATFENQVQAVRRLYQDTVIPRVENDDLYFTDRLKLRDYGLELKTSFEHIPALQEAFELKARARANNAATADKAYNSNMITRNQYLELLDLDPVEGGDLLKAEWDAIQNKDKTQVLATVIGVGGTQSLTEIVTNATLTAEQKVQLLIRIFAFSETDARAVMAGAKEPEPTPQQQ